MRYALFYYLLCHYGKQTKTQLAHIKRKARGIKIERPLQLSFEFGVSKAIVSDWKNKRTKIEKFCSATSDKTL